MVPDCHRRLVAARADLEKSIAELEPDFGGDPQKEEEPDENLVAAKQVRDHPYSTYGSRNLENHVSLGLFCRFGWLASSAGFPALFETFEPQTFKKIKTISKTRP